MHACQAYTSNTEVRASIEGDTTKEVALGEEIGLIGVGLVGTAIAERLVAAGWAVCGYDTDPVRVSSFSCLGITPESSPRIGGQLRVDKPDFLPNLVMLVFEQYAHFRLQRLLQASLLSSAFNKVPFLP